MTCGQSSTRGEEAEIPADAPAEIRQTLSPVENRSENSQNTVKEHKKGQLL